MEKKTFLSAIVSNVAEEVHLGKHLPDVLNQHYRCMPRDWQKL